MSPRGAEQNQKIKDDRLEKILEAARKVFSRKGFAATKITDIAAAAGMSQGLVYHYFPSKETLFTAIVQKAFEGSRWVIASAATQPGTPWDRIRYLCEQMVAGVREKPEYFLITIQVAVTEAAPEEARTALQDYGLSFFTPLVALIQAGQEAGQVVAGNPVELAIAYLAIIQGLAITSLYSSEAMAPHFPTVGTVLRILKA